MANTYTWTIGQCDRTIADGMINTLHWCVNAATEDGTVTAGTYGSVDLEPVDAEDMIPYADVSEAQAISWAQSALGGSEGVSAIHAGLDAQITEQQTPTVGTGTPW